MSAPVSVIIVNWNTKGLLLQCIASLRRVVPADLVREVIVVDNGSNDGSIEALREQEPSATIVEMGRNVGFSTACNAGMRVAEGRYWLLLNPDAYFVEDALSEMVRYAEENSSAGIVGCSLRYENGEPQETAGFFNAATLNLPTQHKGAPDPLTAAAPTDVDWIKGACLLVRAEMGRDVGMLDPRFFVNLETADWSFRAKKRGWQVVLIPQVSVVHLAHRGSLRDWDRLRIEQVKSRQLLHRKHLGQLRFCVHKASTCLQLVAYLLGMGVARIWPLKRPRYLRALVASRLNVSYRPAAARAILRQTLFSTWRSGDANPHPDTTPRVLDAASTSVEVESNVRSS